MLNWIREQLIRQQVKRNGTTAKQFVEWDQIRTICFLVSRDEFYNRPAIDAFVKQSGKTCDVVLFTPVPDATAGKDGLVYSKKQLSLLGLPKAGTLGKVTSGSYDLLVDCNFRVYPSMKWLAATTRAKFKVGASGLPYDNYFDICIDLKTDRNCTSYLKQVENYLKMIRTKNA